MRQLYNTYTGAVGCLVALHGMVDALNGVTPTYAPLTSKFSNRSPDSTVITKETYGARVAFASGAVARIYAGDGLTARVTEEFSDGSLLNAITPISSSVSFVRTFISVSDTALIYGFKSAVGENVTTCLVMPQSPRHDRLRTSRLATRIEYSGTVDTTMTGGLAKGFIADGNNTPSLSGTVLQHSFTSFGSSVTGVYDPETADVRKTLSVLLARDQHGDAFSGDSAIALWPAALGLDDVVTGVVGSWYPVATSYSGTSTFLMRA